MEGHTDVIHELLRHNKIDIEIKSNCDGTNFSNMTGLKPFNIFTNSNVFLQFFILFVSFCKTNIYIVTFLLALDFARFASHHQAENVISGLKISVDNVE